MTADFPELNSFGTLLRFAIALEEAAAEFAGIAAEREICAAWRNDLSACSRRHAKRGRQLERLRRERLNEVVLQAITGMERERYLPTFDLPEDADARQTLTAVAAVEERAASFYTDGGRIAADVLMGVDKTFRKLAHESGEFAAALRAKVL
jgi:hypothetical protein